jgi:hypothetical protein
MNAIVTINSRMVGRPEVIQTAAGGQYREVGFSPAIDRSLLARLPLPIR